MKPQNPNLRVIRRVQVDDKVFEPAKDMLLIMAREIECGLGGGLRIIDPVRAKRLLQMAECAKRQYGPKANMEVFNDGH